MLQDFDEFLGCDRMVDPAGCEELLPSVDEYIGVQNQLQFKLYRNDI